MPTPTEAAVVEAESHGIREQAASAELGQATRVFLDERTRLLRVAFRVVGDSAAAEDVVQEAWVRWQRADRRQIKNPAAFLTTTTTHLAINVIQSARHRRELPTETLPVSLGPAPDPGDRAERAVTIERSLAFLMAKLSPAELAAFLLRKCFDYPYDDVADVLDTSAPNARQLVRRAHLGLSSGRMRRVDRDGHRRLVAAFVYAQETGNLAVLVDLLAEAASRMTRCTRSPGPRGRGPVRPARPAHARAAARSGSVPGGS